MKRFFLFLTNSHGGGGAERATNLLVNILNSKGYDVALYCLNHGVSDSVETQCPTYFLNRIKSQNPFRLLNYIATFRRDVRKLSPACLVVNCELPELFSVFTSRKIRKIVVEHGNPSWQSRKLLGKLVRFILVSIHHAEFVKVSTHLNISLVNNKKVSVIPNLYLEPKYIHQSFGSLERLVYIGRLDLKIKRVNVLIEIAAKLKIPVLFIGEGPALKKIEKIATRLGVVAQFAKWNNNPWMMLSIGDLLCVPSKNEGDGLVVIEAIHARIPIIMTRIDAFQRFNFPEINYFSSVEEAIEKIDIVRNDLSSFVASEELRQSILSERNVEAIIRMWENKFHKSPE